MAEVAQQKTVAAQAEGLAEQAVSGLRALSPADKTWVAAFVVCIFIIVGADAVVAIRTLQSNKESSDRLTEYLIEVEKNRAEALERQATLFGDQNRRNQEVIRALAEAVARDSERAGDAALMAIQRKADEGVADAMSGELQ